MDYNEIVGRLNALGDFWKAWKGEESYFYVAANAIADLLARAEAAEAAQETLQRAMAEYKDRAEKAEMERDAYKIFFDDVSSKNDCNTCTRMNCEHKPRIGETTRFNCFLWQGHK